MIKRIVILTGLFVWFLSFANNSLAQQNSVVIKGQVIDAATNEAMPFVNVVEIDNRGRFVVGTVSDVNGNYAIKVKDSNDSIQVSFIGYKKNTFKIDNRTKIDVTLAQESTTLEEVKIVASKVGNDGITQVRDRATAVTRMEMKDMKSVMSTTVEEMMQGRMGNVDITSTSGDPGAGLNIRIRGTASLNAKNNPLIVINGIPYNAEFDNSFDFGSADVQKFGNLIDVSPEDIESIEVLKDAASTAVWGSKASNGVIMIKTKRGLKSKPIFEYTFKSTIGKEGDPIPMLDGGGYAQLMKEELLNVKLLNENTNIQAKLDGITTSTTYKEIDFDPNWTQYNNYNKNTNWVKEITQTAITNQHDFSVRGGGDKTKYNMSVGYFDEGGTTKGNRLKKLNLRSSLDYDLSTKLRFRSDIMFTRYDQDATYDVEDDDFTSMSYSKPIGYRLVRSVAYRKMPNMSVYERDTTDRSFGQYFTPATTFQGDAATSFNPVAFIANGVNKKVKDNARALFAITYNIVEGLTLNSTVTLDIFDSKQSKFLPYKAIGADYGNGLTNKAVNEFNKKSSITTQNQLIYKPNLGKDHDLGFMTQFDTQDDATRWLKVQTNHSGSPYIQQPVGDKNFDWFGSSITPFRSVGLFGVVNYKFKDKYIFMLGAKEEGTSKFTSQSRWGFFPTASVAWRLSGENFLKDVKFLSDLKLRASWGRTGNLPDKNDLAYQSYKAGTEYSYMGIQGIVPDREQLNSVKYETIEQLNGGLDFAAFDNRLTLSVDVYKKKTLDLYLAYASLPKSTGFSATPQNSGSMENRGVEFQMDITVIKTEDWQLDFNGNFSQNKNVVLTLPSNYQSVIGDMLNGREGQYKISIEPGRPLGGFFGYNFLGVYKTDADAVVTDPKGNTVLGVDGVPLNMIMGGNDPYIFKGGDAKYQDVNHDGKIDELDLVYLGDLNPKYMGGGGIKIRYKNLSMNSFFNFKLGSKIINQTRMETESMYNFDNQSVATKWRWRRPGDDTNIPRALYDMGYNALGSTRFVEDGSFLRLKTLSLSYNFPQKFIQRVKLKDLKLYATGYNLFTWTKYSGQDPDVSPPSNPTELPKDLSRTPPSKRIMIGINVSF